MSTILELVGKYPVQHFAAGALVIEQRHDSGRMYVLLEGEVEVFREGVRIAKASQPGAFFGEMSALLGGAPPRRSARCARRALRSSMIPTLSSAAPRRRACTWPDSSPAGSTR